jgi:hypothetical protein
VLRGLLAGLKWIDAPGSWAFLGLCAAVAVLLAVVWPRRRRMAAAWAGGVLAAYIVLALPCVSLAISSGLPDVSSETLLTSASPELSGGALVVFDGDNRYGRVREAARLYRLLGPTSVWSLGREIWLQDALREAGIPHVTHVSSTTTTREQIAWTTALERASSAPIVIVASRLQAPRVAALLCAAGARARLAPAPVDDEPASSGLRTIVPSYFALRVSRDALYEHMALFYYRQKGWIA